MKTTRSGISVACHWNGKFNISDMLVPAFDYCSSFKSLLTGKVLISKKSCFNEGEMLIANTKSLHIKLSQHCHWFLGDSKAHLCVYTRRHRLLLFYHNISLNVPSNFLREWQLSPQTSHISEAGGVKSDELTSHPNYAIMRRSYNQKYCKKLLNTTSWRKHYKTSSRFSPRNNNSILFSHLWSFAYHIICTVIIVFARQLNHLCHNTQSWHKKKSYYTVTSGCQHLFSKIYEKPCQQRELLQPSGAFSWTVLTSLRRSLELLRWELVASLMLSSSLFLPLLLVGTFI